MKSTHCDNGIVEVYTISMDAGETFTVSPAIGEDQKDFFDKNGWLYAWAVTFVNKGLANLDIDIVGPPVTVDPHHDLWINGCDKMSGNSYEIRAETNAEIVCLSYKDNTLPRHHDKRWLNRGDRYELSHKGWLYVAGGCLQVGKEKLPAESLLRVQNPGTSCTMTDPGIIAFIGEKGGARDR